MRWSISYLHYHYIIFNFYCQYFFLTFFYFSFNISIIFIIATIIINIINKILNTIANVSIFLFLSWLHYKYIIDQIKSQYFFIFFLIFFGSIPTHTTDPDVSSDDLMGDLFYKRSFSTSNIIIAKVQVKVNSFFLTFFNFFLGG